MNEDLEVYTGEEEATKKQAAIVQPFAQTTDLEPYVGEGNLEVYTGDEDKTSERKKESGSPGIFDTGRSAIAGVIRTASSILSVPQINLMEAEKSPLEKGIDFLDKLAEDISPKKTDSWYDYIPQATESAAQSLSAGAIGAMAKGRGGSTASRFAAGITGKGALFGSKQYYDFMNEVREGLTKEGLSKDDIMEGMKHAKKYAAVSGAFEMAGEIGSDLIGAKAFGFINKPVKGAITEAAKKGIMPILKKYGIAELAEIGGEEMTTVGQHYTTKLAAEELPKAGLKQGDLGQQMVDTAIVTAISTLMMGAGFDAYNARQRRKLVNKVANETGKPVDEVRKGLDDILSRVKADEAPLPETIDMTGLQEAEGKQAQEELKESYEQHALKRVKSALANEGKAYEKEYTELMQTPSTYSWLQEETPAEASNPSEQATSATLPVAQETEAGDIIPPTEVGETDEISKVVREAAIPGQSEPSSVGINYIPTGQVQKGEPTDADLEETEKFLQDLDKEDLTNKEIADFISKESEMSGVSEEKQRRRTAIEEKLESLDKADEKIAATEARIVQDNGYDKMDIPQLEEKLSSMLGKEGMNNKEAKWTLGHIDALSAILHDKTGLSEYLNHYGNYEVVEGKRGQWSIQPYIGKLEEVPKEEGEREEAPPEKAITVNPLHVPADVATDMIDRMKQRGIKATDTDFPKFLAAHIAESMANNGADLDSIEKNVVNIYDALQEKDSPFYTELVRAMSPSQLRQYTKDMEYVLDYYNDARDAMSSQTTLSFMGTGDVIRLVKQFPDDARYIVALGKKAWTAGKQTLDTWMQQMQTWLGEVFDQVKASYAWRLLNDDRGFLGGTFARNAPISTLSRAKDMLDLGYSDNKIWKETGWKKAPDDKWRFEIDTEEAIIFPEVLNEKPYTWHMLPEALELEKLYENYPHLRRLVVKYDPLLEAYGSYSFDEFTGAGTITIRQTLDYGQYINTLLHEIEHAIQRYEQFSTGTNPMSAHMLKEQAYDDFRLIQLARDMKTAGNDPNKMAAMNIIPDMIGSDLYTEAKRMADFYSDQGLDNMYMKTLGLLEKIGNKDPHGIYTHVLGEAEAREIGKRYNMTPEQRKAIAPSWDGIPESKLIIWFKGGQAYSMNQDVKKSTTFRKQKKAATRTNPQVPDTTVDLREKQKDIRLWRSVIENAHKINDKNFPQIARDLITRMYMSKSDWTVWTVNDSIYIDRITASMTDAERAWIMKAGNAIYDLSRKAMKANLDAGMDRKTAVAFKDMYTERATGIVFRSHKNLEPIYRRIRKEFFEPMRERIRLHEIQAALQHPKRNYMDALREFRKNPLDPGNLAKAASKHGIKTAADLRAFADYVRGYLAKVNELKTWGFEDYWPRYMTGDLLIKGRDGKGKVVWTSVADTTELAETRIENQIKERPGLTYTIEKRSPYEHEQATPVTRGRYFAVRRQFKKAGVEMPEGIVTIKPGSIFAGPLAETKYILPGEDDIRKAMFIYSNSINKKLAFDPTVWQMRRHMDSFAPNVRKHVQSVFDNAKGSKYYVEDRIVDDIFGREGHRIASKFVNRLRGVYVALKLGYDVKKGLFNGLGNYGMTAVNFKNDILVRGSKFMRSKEGQAFLKSIKNYMGDRAFVEGEQLRHGVRVGNKLLEGKATLLTPTGVFNILELPGRKWNACCAHEYYVKLETALGRTYDEDMEEEAQIFALQNIDMLQGLTTSALMGEAFRAPTGRLLTLFKPFMVRNIEWMIHRGNDPSFWARWIPFMFMMAGGRGLWTMLVSIPLLKLAFSALGYGDVFGRAHLKMLEVQNTLAKGFASGIAGMANKDIVAPMTWQFPQTEWDWLGVVGMAVQTVQGAGKVIGPNWQEEGKDQLKREIAIARLIIESMEAYRNPDGWVYMNGKKQFNMLAKSDVYFFGPLGVRSYEQSFNMYLLQVEKEDKNFRDKKVAGLKEYMHTVVKDNLLRDKDIPPSAIQYVNEQVQKYQLTDVDFIKHIENAEKTPALRTLEFALEQNKIQVNKDIESAGAATGYDFLNGKRR